MLLAMTYLMMSFFAVLPVYLRLINNCYDYRNFFQPSNFIDAKTSAFKFIATVG